MNWRALLERLRAGFSGSPDAADVLDAADRLPNGFGRRAFLKTALVGVAVAATVDVEQLLWTPGEKTIFLPTLDKTVVLLDETVFANYNTLLDTDWIAKDLLRDLERNLDLVGRFSRQYDAQFSGRRARVGDTVLVRVPKRFEPDDHSGIIIERAVPVVLTALPRRRRRA